MKPKSFWSIKGKIISRNLTEDINFYVRFYPYLAQTFIREDGNNVIYDLTFSCYYNPDQKWPFIDYTWDNVITYTKIKIV